VNLRPKLINYKLPEEEKLQKTLGIAWF